MTNILVVEGNSPELVTKSATGAIFGAAEQYADKLQQFAPDVKFDICRPHFPEFHLSQIAFETYAGFAFTGSGVKWSASDEEAAPARAVMQSALQSGKPVLGSCYGMQLAIDVLGGRALANPKGAEHGIAANIQLTEAGAEHPLFFGKPRQFDALCMHRDVCSDLPEGAVLLAGNAHTDIQAVAVERDGLIFWGVQYHPELEFAQIASYFRRSQVESFSQPESLAHITGLANLSAEEIARDFDRLQAANDNATLISKYKLSDALLDRHIHEIELKNWMQLVLNSAG